MTALRLDGRSELRALRVRELMKRSGMAGALGVSESLVPHAFYSLVGASSLLFAVAPECRRLTGLDPETDEAVEAHAEYVARLLVP